MVPLTDASLAAAALAGGDGGTIAPLVIGFLVVDAVVILIIWLAMRGRRRPPDQP